MKSVFRSMGDVNYNLAGGSSVQSREACVLGNCESVVHLNHNN